jgi:hypothetical protein
MPTQLGPGKKKISRGLLEKSKLAEYAYEEGQWRSWNEIRIIQLEINVTYKTY